MKIEFETDINGYQEARKFKLLIDDILQYEELDQSLNSLATSLQTQLDEFLSNPEFSGFADTNSNEIYTSRHEQSAGEGFNRLFRSLFGPGKRELELSKQRQELVMRAERAEASAFEVLAEMAEIGRERDELRERLKQAGSDKPKTEESV